MKKCFKITEVGGHLASIFQMMQKEVELRKIVKSWDLMGILDLMRTITTELGWKILKG